MNFFNGFPEFTSWPRMSVAKIWAQEHNKTPQGRKRPMSPDKVLKEWRHRHYKEGIENGIRLAFYRDHGRFQRVQIPAIGLAHIRPAWSASLGRLKESVVVEVEDRSWWVRESINGECTFQSPDFVQSVELSEQRRIILPSDTQRKGSTLIHRV